MERHFMNKQVGEHFGASKRDETAEGEGKKKHGEKGGGHLPDIHIKSHEHGHTVHVLPHKDSGMQAEAPTEYEKGDVEGISDHIHRTLGSPGQDHGEKGGEGGASDELDASLGM